MISTKESRSHLNESVAGAMVKGIGFGTQLPKSRFLSDRFAYFEEGDRFAVVAGEQEGDDVELALALGLSYRGARRLVLVLPEAHCFATMQRAPWLREEARPAIYLHNGEQIVGGELDPWSQKRTTDNIKERLDGGDPAQELRDASTPVHLKQEGPRLYELVEWATKLAELDAGHRRSQRAWSCMGQRVLSIAVGHEVVVKAGIHRGAADHVPAQVEISKDEDLSPDQLQSLMAGVELGVRERLCGDMHHADEHWLQAALRRRPPLLGMEPTALRELPAWRPKDAPGPGGEGRWGRGFIDLIGVDGHGDIRIVETKLSTNKDHMLILQGLDYYVWAQAYRQALQQRLGVGPSANFEIHYVLGDTTDGKIHSSEHAGAQADALCNEIPWRFQTVRDWYHGPTAATSKGSVCDRASEQPVVRASDLRTFPVDP